MTEEERQRTARVIGKRNQSRLHQLKELDRANQQKAETKDDIPVKSE